jgi:uroporphyrinogen decarboxylase
VETSRERVLKTINHEQPEVTPISLEGIFDLQKWYEYFGTSDRILLREKLNLDVLAARAVYVGPRCSEGLSIWGTPLDGVYGAKGVGFGVGRKYPLATVRSIKDVESYQWPDSKDFNYAILGAVFGSMPTSRAKRIEGKYGIHKEEESYRHMSQTGPWMPLLCTLFDLFGLENTLEKMYLEPELIAAAIVHIELFLLEYYERCLQEAGEFADMVYFGDDFATQSGMMISPDHWRQYLLPTYKKLFALIKRAGKKVWMHSCGSFHEVMPDLIDTGLDVWETVQVQARGNDPQSLKRKYGDNITFYGGISTQTTLPFGSVSDVRKEVRERVRVLGRRGGYICGADHGIMPDVPIENVLAMFDEARSFGAR